MNLEQSLLIKLSAAADLAATIEKKTEEMEKALADGNGLTFRSLLKEVELDAAAAAFTAAQIRSITNRMLWL